MAFEKPQDGEFNEVILRIKEGEMAALEGMRDPAVKAARKLSGLKDGPEVDAILELRDQDQLE